MAIELTAQRGRAATLFRLALAGLIAAAGPGCGLKMARPVPSALMAECDNLRPAPGWVVNRLAQTAPDLHFELGAHDLGVPERKELARIAPALKEILRDYGELVIVLEGHCDDRGPADFNRLLGERRAEAVRRVLVSQGFPADHLRVVSLGDGLPQCFTRDEACRYKNRRVHFRAAQGAAAEKAHRGRPPAIKSTMALRGMKQTG